MDFYLDIGFAVLLRYLRDRGPDNAYRKAFLKVFRAIWNAYKDDAEFIEQLDLAPTRKAGLM